MVRRLPSHAQRTVEALWRAIERSEYDQRQGLPETHARRVVATALADDDIDESISDEEVEHHLRFLQNHGEIYYVHDWVRITDPEKVASDFVDDESEDEN